MNNVTTNLEMADVIGGKQILQYWPVVIALILGFSSTYILCEWIQHTEEKQVKEKFVERVEGISAEFERHLVSYEYTLKMLRAAFLASDYVSQEEYEILSAGILLNRPDIKGVHFIPKINTGLTAKPLPYWYVEGGTRKEVLLKEEMSPLVIRRSVSLDYFESLVGLDLGYYSDFEESIEKSFSENIVVASMPVTLFPEIDDVFLYYPLFQKSRVKNLSDRYKNILSQYNAGAGFLSLSIQIDDFFKNQKEYNGVHISLNLMDKEGEKAPLYMSDARSPDVWHEDVVNMFSKQWKFEYSPIDSEELRVVRNEFIIFISGMTLSLLLAVYIGTSIYQKEKDFILNQTLNQERMYLNGILGNMMQGVITIDDLGTIITFNKWAEKIFGYSAAEIISKNVTELMPQKYRDEHKNSLHDYLESGQKKIMGQELELQGLRKNGQTFPMAINITEIEEEEGSVVIVLTRDISDQIRREKQLKDAIDIAEKSSQAKSDFLANMSHELRTPLNSIMGLSRLLSEDKAIKNDNLSMINTIKKASNNLLIIVNDILDISKIESGNIVLEEIGFDFNEVLLNIIEIMGPVASKKGVALNYKCNKKKIPYVIGDSFRVNRILTNLIGNAVKYTDGKDEEKGSQKVTIDIKVNDIDKENVEILCRVIDTGIGIPQNKLDVIFEKFSQADASTTRKYGGTGLGLAITQDLVEMMGGEICVESEEGVGSTFWFTIPFKTTKEIQKNKSFKSKDKKTSQKPIHDLDTVKVMIAEDNELNQMFIKRAMKKIGIENYDIYDNGALAVEAFEEKEYDIILMDCHMPEKNGYEATTDIRESKKKEGSAIPIVALTADAMTGTRERCIEIGMNEYITKPIEIDELKRVLSQWVNFDEA